MFSATRTEKILDAAELATWRKISPLINRINKAFLASLETGGKPSLRAYERAMRDIMRDGLVFDYGKSFSAGVVESDRELVAMVKAEGNLTDAEQAALLARHTPSDLVLLEVFDEEEIQSILSEIRIRPVPIEAVAEQLLGVEPTAALRRMGQRAKQLAVRFGKDQSRVIKKSVSAFIKGDTGRREAVKSIQESMQKGRKAALRVVRTETTWAYTAGKAELGLQTKGVTHMMFRSVNDNRRSDICESRDKKVWPVSDRSGIRENSPPLHPNCRSTWELIIGALSRNKPRVAAPEAVPLKTGDEGYEPLGKGWNPTSATGIRKSARRRVA